MRSLPLLKPRQCGLCRACCTTQRIDDPQLQKEKDERCPHLAEDENAKGCTIYRSRPNACRAWKCVWLSGSPVVEGYERPDRVGIVLDTVVDKRLPFSFLCGVAIDPTDPDKCFEMADAMVKRLVRKGHLVVLEKPGDKGEQIIQGPQGKVDVYVKTMQAAVGHG